MDIYSNSIPSSSPEYLFPGENNMEGGDGAVSLEWLSAFVEECLNGGGFTAQPPPPPMPPTTNSTASRPTTVLPSPTTKARSKRRKLDPESPLVPQAYWLAESELIPLPSRKEEEEELHEEEVVEEEERRRCAHCMSQKTPQWRAGPLGPKTLCNACGVRFKSGRLLPEYRPAKSPTFRTYKHSNSHKKVMEMRSMSTTISSSSDADANAD